MLCRVLIAAVVVICTLSCIHAHVNAGTERLNQIKDLICVFLLSGMQKEDLDVSVLTKLQRHNVNIGDLNNEELLEKCIQTHSNKIIKVMNVSGNQPFLKNNLLIDSAKGTVDFYNNSVLHKKGDNFGTKVNKVEGPNNTYNNNPRRIDVIQYNDGQPKLESVLKFWQDMGINIATTESLQRSVSTQDITKNGIYKPEQNKRSIEDSRFHEADVINSFLTNFLTKGNNMSVAPTTQKSINLGDKHEEIYALQRQDMGKMSGVNPDFQNYYPYLPSKLNQRFTSMDRELEVEGVLKTPYIARARDYRNPKSVMTESPNLIKNLYLQDFQGSEAIQTNTEEDPKYLISRNTIKEIAESVKEIILRELRNEMHETTLSTSTTTTRTNMSTNVIPSKTKTDSISQTTHTDLRSQESLMNKFLELFEEIKSLKQNSIIITSENKNDLDITKNPYEIDTNKIKMAKTFPQVTATRLPNSIPPKLFYNNQVFGIKNPSADNILNFSPQLHKIRSSSALEIREPFKVLQPITVQTNNIEIPPLGIPLSKPQNLINQNIIITTPAPYRIVANMKKINQRGSKHMDSDKNKPYEVYESKQSYATLSKERYEHPAHRIHSNYKDDIIRFTLNKNGHSKYSSDYYEKINLGKYNSHPDSEAYGFKPQEIPSFHERLEKAGRIQDFPRHNKYISKVDCCNEKYAYSKAMTDCCNRKIASRQQMSFDNMEKNSYDDTHFKNFLKSQQKVTDMLEKILSDKGNVQSVETA